MWGELVAQPSSNLSERFYQTYLPDIAHLPDARKRLGTYFKPWPNNAFDIYPDQVDFMQFLPLSPTRTMIREIANFIPLPDGRYLRTGGGVTRQEVAKFSAKDAEMLDIYDARTQAVADVLSALVLRVPPNVTSGGSWRDALPEMIRAAGLGSRMRSLGIDL